MARGEVYVPLSVDYADDPKIIAAGERAEVLYVRALCLCKRTLSDGFVADVQLARFGLSGVQSRAKRLVDAGLWARVDGGYQIVAWLKRNKSRAQIEADGEVESSSGSFGNHVRWHVKRRVTVAGCRFCTGSTDREPESGGDRIPDREGDREGRIRPESTETETETDNNSSSSDSRGPEPALDDDEVAQANPAVGRRVDPEAVRSEFGKPNRKLETALSILADRDLTARQARADREPLHDVDAWTRKAIQRRRARHGADLIRLIAEHPRLTPTELADRLDDRLDHQHDDAQAAARARAEEGIAHVRDLAQTPPDPDLNVAGTSAARRALRSVPDQEPESV